MSDLKQLRQQLKQQMHRRLVIISGSNEWHNQHLAGLFDPTEEVFWITGSCEESDHHGIPEHYQNHQYECIEAKRLTYYLGQEIDGAVIDVRQGVSADALGIISGMIKAGGLFVLLVPEIIEWQNLNNPEDSRFLNTPLTPNQAHKSFTQHLINSWLTDEVIWLTEGQVTSDLTEHLAINDTQAQTTLPTQDQTSAIEKIHSVAFGHRKRPLVISADRGRGKSATLGLAAVQCLLDGKQHIALTASRPDQVKTAFKHALSQLEQDNAAQAEQIEVLTNKTQLIEFRYKGELKTIEYIAPDHLILNPTSADLLLVDEAAHLPTPLLIELLQRHHRMVFSTTLHGYEGSGRGFELRFKKYLQKYTPDWKQINLQTPIRWAENDPLETAIFDALLLDAKMPDLDESIFTDQENNQAISYQILDNKTLLEDAQKMRSLFGLLVQAHYQTSPNDLQQLLNAPNIHIITAQQETDNGSKILGAVLCIEEGKINPSKARAHGHLVPQVLTKHYAQQDFLLLSTLRVMRIAVHPAVQRHGIGKQLIQEVEKLGQQKRMDYISSSFGASEELLPFWSQQNFWPLHVGVKRDKASGTHNIVVAKPVSAMSRQALSLIQNRFQEQFPHLLLEALPNLPAPQILCIMQTFRFKSRNYGLDKAVANYSTDERPYESISSKLWEWSLQSANKIREASLTEQSIWCDKVLKRNDWQTVAHHHHLAGRKGVEQVLKEMIKKWNSQLNSTNKVTNMPRRYVEKRSL